MDQVTKTATDNWLALSRLDRLLLLTRDAYEEVPEIESWDELDQTDWFVEWSLTTMKMAELAKMESQMTTEQRAAYQEVLALVEKNTPILKRLGVRPI